MNTAVPFYPNHEDGMRCMLAVYRSVLDALLDRKTSWEEIAHLTGYTSGKASWSVKMLTYLADQHLDIKMIEPFDYERYKTEGDAYLRDFYNHDELYWQLKNTNILEIRPLIPRFLDKIHPVFRKPTLKDIDGMLDEGRLVFVTLNSKALDNEPGFSSHAVLVIDHDDSSFTFHDPGHNPKPNRVESKQKFYEAMGGGNTTSEVTGFKRQT